MNEKHPYTLILKPAKNLFIYLLPNLLIFLAVLFFLFCYASFTDYTSPRFIWTLLFFVVLLISSDTFSNVIWALTGEETITIDDSTLTIIRNTGGFQKKYVYELAEIKDITQATDEVTNTGFKLYPVGVIGIPIFTYKDPIILHFYYSGVRKRIGNYCDRFSAEELQNEILSRQGNRKHK